MSFRWRPGRPWMLFPGSAFQLPARAAQGGADAARRRAADSVSAADRRFGRERLGKRAKLRRLGPDDLAQIALSLGRFAAPPGSALMRGAERDSPAHELLGDV